MGEQPAFADAIDTLEFERIRTHIAGRCATMYGQLRTQALLPMTIPAEIQDELTRVSEVIRLVETGDRPPLAEVPDIRAVLHRASKDGSVVPAEDFRDILSVLKLFRELRAFLLKRKEQLVLLTHTANELPEKKLLEFHIDRVVDDEGSVKDGASKVLRTIRRELIEKSGQLRRRMENILKRAAEQEMVMEELVTMRDGRMVLPVRAEYKRQIQGFVHSTSATGQTVYIEPAETLELNNDIRDLQFAEQREVATILTELTSRLRDDVPFIFTGLHALGELDSLYARALYAHDMLASCPRVKRDAPHILRQARHPLLLLQRKMQDVVALDISIGDDATTIIITGPNAGGKSVAMKTVGLLALMLQAGIPVTCDEESNFAVYEKIFVDIGDEQSLENDLSTFSSHIARLARIVDGAGPRTLVLIDEIGTGTDPAEGAALGAAILETLTHLKAHVIATTHHGMLKAFAHEKEGMENAAMEFDVQSLQPTYRFRAGLPGSSYAFEITRRHGMNPDIIGRAEVILGTQSNALEQLLAEVEKQSQSLGNRLRRSEQLEETYLALKEEYEKKIKSARNEAADLRKQALEEAQQIVLKARASIEQTIQDIREEQASRQAIKHARERLEEQKRSIATELREIAPVQTTSITEEKPFIAGEHVFLMDNPAVIGIVLDAAAGTKIPVAFGSMRMVVDAKKLRRHESADKPVQGGYIHTEAVDSNEIDVRGLYGDEAVRKVDLFLYQAWTSGLKRVDIIHGKGTGALRQRLHVYLKDVPFVESFQLGEWNEGGSGVTKVLFTPD